MKKVILPQDWQALIQRPTETRESLDALVRSIFNEVERDGDIAIPQIQLAV